MKFCIKNEPSIIVSAHTAVNGAIKIIRRVVRNRKIKNTLRYNINEELVLSDVNKKDYFYIYIIRENKENKMLNKYYSFDYKIELFKKLAEK